MSVLITNDDLFGKGQDWPDGEYVGDITESVVLNGDGTEVYQILRNITTKAGETQVGTFAIGARPQFVHIVTDHPEQWRAERGRRQALQLMIATGLAPKPNKKEPAEFPFDPAKEPERLATETAGKRVKFVLRTRRWKDKETGEDRSSQNVVAFLAP